MPAENHHPVRTAVAPYADGRLTPQRAAVVEAAQGAGGAFTAERLGDLLRERGTVVGTATLYRALAALEASGWLERVGERGGSALYARCDAGGGHHHHVVCDACGRVEATPCPVASGANAAAEAAGFRVTRHEVTLYGLCAACAEADPGPAGAASGTEE